MRLPPVLILALSFGLLGGEAHAEWTRLRSTNFTFVGDASERQIRRVAQQLEQFREVRARRLRSQTVQYEGTKPRRRTQEVTL